MDILKITPELWELIEVENSPIQYVGRYQYNLGLGSPYSHVIGYQVQFLTKTKQEAVNKYRDWLGEIVEVWINEGTSAILGYNGEYFSKVITLAQKIHNRQITALATYDFHAIDYQPVKDGEEKSHAEILYKQCLKINNIRKK